MKKTLVAMAALAATGAFAQMTMNVNDKTTITPYVALDIGYRGINQASGSPKANSADVVDNADGFGSHWGIKGGTELGGGYNAFFQLEQGLQTQDTGFNGTGDQVFGNGTQGRVGEVGINAPWGKLEIGQMWGTYDNIAGAADQTGYTFTSGWGAVMNGGGFAISGTSVAHLDNGNTGAAHGSMSGAIQYTTPNAGGLTVSVLYAPQTDPNTSSNVNSSGAMVNYAAGPLTVGFGMDRTPTNSNIGGGIVAADTGGMTNAWIGTVAYDLKVAVVSAAAFGATANGETLASNQDKDAGYALSAKFPVGQWTFSGSWGSVNSSGSDFVNSQTINALGLQAEYALNAHISAYVAAGTTMVTNVGGASTGSQNTTTGVVGFHAGF